MLISKEDSLAYALGIFASDGINLYLEIASGVDTTLVEEISKGLRYGILSIADSNTVRYDDVNSQKAYKAGLQVGMLVRKNVIPNINQELYGENPHQSISDSLFCEGFIDGQSTIERILTKEQVSQIINRNTHLLQN